MLGARNATPWSVIVTGANMSGHAEIAGAGGRSLLRDWPAVASPVVAAASDHPAARETGAGARMRVSMDAAETWPSLASRSARRITGWHENDHAGDALVRMLAFAVAAWHQNRAAERVAEAGVPRPFGGWLAPEYDATHDRDANAIQASRVLIRETMRMVGAHLWRMGVHPEHFVPMLRDAIRHASEETMAGPESTRLLRDAVTRGIEGYYACQARESGREPVTGDVPVNSGRHER